jgi:hypothetical protein
MILILILILVSSLTNETPMIEPKDIDEPILIPQIGVTSEMKGNAV